MPARLEGVHGVPPGEYRALGRHPDLAPAVSAPFTVEADGEARTALVLAVPATVRGRLIGAGRGARELTGLGDLDVIGRPVQDVLGLQFESGDDHIGTALEWGVRVLDNRAHARCREVVVDQRAWRGQPGMQVVVIAPPGGGFRSRPDICR